MKEILQLVILFLAVCTTTAAQVEPAATGPSVPIPAGKLNYSINYAQTAEFGGGLGDWQMSTLSGLLDYSNVSDRLPFSLDFGGGYNWTIVGPSYGTGFFEHLVVSQGMVWRKWTASVDDNVSYTPEAPTFGFTGIPGIGEPITGPNSSPPTSNQSILTLNTHVVDNTVNGNISHNLNHALIFNLGGSYDLFRFPDGNGLATNTAVANGGLRWRLDARNSLLGNYQFSQFTYPDLNFSFQTQSGLFGFERIWSRKITSNVSMGPEWTSSSNSMAVPSSVGMAANATVTYQFGHSSASLNYVRGVNGGAGYLLGAQTDTATAEYSRDFGRDLTIGVTGSYMRTAGLAGNGITTGKYGGAQATRRLGRYLTVFSSYSAIAQSSSAALPGNTLGQLIQVVGFGFGYSPRPTRLTH